MADRSITTPDEYLAAIQSVRLVYEAEIGRLQAEIERWKVIADDNDRAYCIMRDEVERSRFTKEIHDASQRVDELPDWKKTMRDRSVEASEYTKGSAVIESRRIVSEPGAAIEVTEYTLSPAARAALNLGDTKLPDCDDEGES